MKRRPCMKFIPEYIRGQIVAMKERGATNRQVSRILDLPHSFVDRFVRGNIGLREEIINTLLDMQRIPLNPAPVDEDRWDFLNERLWVLAKKLHEIVDGGDTK